MNRYERVHSWKERVKGLLKEPGQKLFEFYRVISATGYEELSVSGVEMCRPPHQYAEATPEKLTEVCATDYGAGAFVALEVGEGLEGSPLSFWTIRILSADQCGAIQVRPSNELLRSLWKREILLPNYGCKDEAWFIQRGTAATMVAMTFLPKMPVPRFRPKKRIQKGKQRRPGKPPTREVTKAASYLNGGLTPKKTEEKLKKDFGETLWKGKSEHELDSAAYLAVEAAKKRRTRQRKNQEE